MACGWGLAIVSTQGANLGVAQIGIEFICGLGINPVRFVEEVSQLGCRHVGLALEPIVTCNGIDAGWSLRSDPKLRREVAGALRDRGVSISLGEGFVAMPHSELSPQFNGDMALLAELGAPCVNLVSVDADASRAFDHCGRFAELAASHGMRATVEFVPGLPVIKDLRTAVAAVRHVARPDFGIVIDAMHLFRSGGSAADVAQLDAAEIGYVQLCDVPETSSFSSYADEARFERLPPGKGELPLKELLQILPPDMSLGLEIPMRSEAERGVSIVERLGPAVDAARRLLEERSFGCGSI